MNEQVKLAKPERPVIVVQRGRRIVESNYILLLGPRDQVLGRVIYDPPNNPSKDYQVKAWLEINTDLVKLRIA